MKQCGVWAIVVLFSFEVLAARAEVKSVYLGDYLSASTSEDDCVEVLSADTEVAQEAEESSSLVDEIEANMTPELKKKFAKQADVLVSEVLAAAGWGDLPAHIKSFGVGAQKEVLEHARMIGSRAKNILTDSENSVRAEAVRDLEDLHEHIQANEPASIFKKAKGGWGKLMPSTAARSSRIMARAASAFLSAQEKTDKLTTKLANSVESLEADQKKLSGLFQLLSSSHKPVLQNIYLCNLLIERVQDEMAQTTDPNKQQLLNAMGRRLASGRRDLATVLEVRFQAVATAGVMMDNNELLIGEIRRTNMVVSNLFSLGMSLHSVLESQATQVGVVQKTRAATSKLMLSNAKALGKQGDAIRQLEEENVIDVKSLHEAHRHVLTSIQEAASQRAANFDKLLEASEDILQQAKELKEGLKDYQQQGQIAAPEPTASELKALESKEIP